MDAFLLSAIEAGQALRDGTLSSEELVVACLGRVRELEDSISAWAYLDEGYALEQARGSDARRQRGEALGPLDGIPVGIKDIIDTANMPTEHGTVLYSGRTPAQDATLVQLLREAGAVIMGKTVTAELAMFGPGKTRNPHNPGHTPGGSSSGSAAAVACGMIPLSVGTQTGGSVIRPASFCGIFALKPSHGLISRRGVLMLSRHMDTVGVYGRTLQDVALIGETLMRHDEGDADMVCRPQPRLSATMAGEAPRDPRFAFVRTPAWDRADPSTMDSFGELIDNLNRKGKRLDPIDLPPSFDDVYDIYSLIAEPEIAKSLAREYDDGKDKLSPRLCGLIERGRKVTAIDYNVALERVGEFGEALNAIFRDYDAIVTPSAVGEAPVGLESTGDSVFNKIWTLCGTPALNLPVLRGPNDLPVGIQLVARKGDDARLFRTARWLLEKMDED